MGAAVFSSLTEGEDQPEQSCTVSEPSGGMLLSAFGPAEALSIASWCGHHDMLDLANACTQTREIIMTDDIWRQMLLQHFQPSLQLAFELNKSGMLDAVNKLPSGEAVKLYAKLSKVTAKPFVLQPRARLVLEIHELKEWDQRQKEFLLQRQAKLLTGALHRTEESATIGRQMSANVLELISLLALMGNGTVPPLGQLPELQLGPSVNKDVQDSLKTRMQKRRQWWQKQREYLLQDLNWSG